MGPAHWRVLTPGRLVALLRPGTGALRTQVIGLPQLSHYRLGGESIQLEGLMAGGMAPHQFDPVARAIQSIGQQSHQRLVGRRIDWRRGDLDAQRIAERLPDFIGRGARLQFDREQHPIRLRM